MFNLPESLIKTANELLEANKFQVGKKIHLGFGAKGGTGFIGKITKVDHDNKEIHIENDKGKTYKGPMRFASHLNEDVQIDEISDEKKRKYLDAAIDDLGKKFRAKADPKYLTPTGKLKKSYLNSAERKRKMDHFNARRNSIQKTAIAVTGKKHFADLNSEPYNAPMKYVKESHYEETQIDEISKKLTQNYIDKARKENDARRKSISDGDISKNMRKKLKRSDSISLAYKKLHNWRAKVGATNEESQIDETNNAMKRIKLIDKIKKSTGPLSQTAKNLEKKKETKEETQIDELSKKTLKNYTKKAVDDVAQHASIHTIYGNENSLKKLRNRIKGIKRAAKKLEIKAKEPKLAVAAESIEEGAMDDALRKIEKNFSPKAKKFDQKVSHHAKGIEMGVAKFKGAEKDLSHHVEKLKRIRRHLKRVQGKGSDYDSLFNSNLKHANAALKQVGESLNTVKTPSAQKLATKYKMSVSDMNKLIAQGAKVEKEHTKNDKDAAQIARDHIKERPDYYVKLKKIEENIAAHDVASDNDVYGRRVAAEGLSYVDGANDPWSCGFEDAKKGKSIKSNPHKRGTNAHTEYNSGHNYAQKKAHKIFAKDGYKVNKITSHQKTERKIDEACQTDVEKAKKLQQELNKKLAKTYEKAKKITKVINK